MITTFWQKLRSLLILTICSLVGCNKDVSDLTISEQAIQKSSRFSGDISRDRYRKPLEVLNFISIQPGMTVVDILGGGGYYSELFSHIVGESGRVYLQNNSLFLRFSEKELSKRLKNNRLANVIRLDSEYSDMKLPPNADILFFGLSFHDFFVQREDPVITAIPEIFFEQIKASLKPGGLLVLIDHSDKSEAGIGRTSQLHRIEEEWVQKSLESEGFELLEKLNTLRNPEDDYNLDIWKKAVFHKTDRFIHKYKLKN